MKKLNLITSQTSINLALTVVLAVLGLMTPAIAQQNINDEIDSELEQISSEVKMGPASQTTLDNSETTQASGQTTVNIQNNLQDQQDIQASSKASNKTLVTQQQVQKQPTTIIEDSPLTESRAEKMRKARVETELQTEQRIVEKLEQSRMEDEKRRAGVLFGEKFDSLTGERAQVPANVQTPPPVYVQTRDNDTRNIVREELESLKNEQELDQTPIQTKFMSVGLGLVDIPGVANARGNYAFNINFGKKTDNLIVEGGFVYGNYTMDSLFLGGYYNYYMASRVNIDQFGGTLGVKIQLFEGMVKPVIGGVAQYSYRSFSLDNNYNTFYNNSYSTTYSHAVDVGLNVGVDVEVSKELTLGVDYKYFKNIYSRMDDTYNWRTGSTVGTPIEKISYYMWTLSGKMTF